MKKQYCIYILLGLFSVLGISSCQELDTRTFYPHSTPVIESATITPSTFTYGDSITITAKVSDSQTPLSTLELKMVVNDRVVATQTIRTKGNNADVNVKFPTKFIGGLPNNANVQVMLNLINTEGDVTEGSVANVIGKRPEFQSLYLVLDYGVAVPLSLEKAADGAAEADKYRYASLPSPLQTMANTIKYKIASKITKDDQIDFSGYVWGNDNGTFGLINEDGGYWTTSEPMKKNTLQVVFDAFAFNTSLVGPDLENLATLTMAKLASTLTYNGESFKEASFYVQQNRKIALSAEFKDVLFNMDYFKRVAADTVQYLGATGPITFDYSASRQILLVQEIYPQAPTVLLACGSGLGYPSKVKPEATSNWGFSPILQFILFRNIGNNVYQGTVYFDAVNANFKFFENNGWGNEKRSDDYVLPSILVTSASKNKTDGNWYPAANAKSGNYTITIDMNSKVVTATPIAL